MTANIDLSKISWDRLPNPTQWPWYRSYEVRQAAARALGIAATAGLGYSYLTFRISKNPSFSYLTIITSLVLGLLALVLLRWPLSHEDPYNSLQQRREIRHKLRTDSQYGYKDMPKDVLSWGEINIVLRSFLECQTYSAFVQQHGQEATQVLNDENDAFMQEKCRAEKKEAIYRNLQTNPQYGYKDIEGTYLSVGNLNVVFGTDIQRLTYSEFISRHGVDVLAILNPLNLKNLRLKFHSHFLERKIVGENPEIPAVFKFTPEELASFEADSSVLRLKQRKESPKSFVESSGDIAALSHPEAIAYALSPYRDKILNEKLSFKVHDFHEVRLAAKDPQCREALRAKFFKLSYSEMMNAKSARECLNITESELKEKVCALWNNSDWREDFPDREGFYSALTTLFPPAYWRDKIVRETAGMSLFEIATLYPELFAKGVLTAEAGQPPFRQQLHQEFKNDHSWETWVDRCPPVLLETKILNPKALAAAYLVLDYILRHPLDYLHFMPDSNPASPGFNYNLRMVSYLPDDIKERWRFRNEHENRKARYFEPLWKQKDIVDRQKQQLCLPRLPHGTYTPEQMESAFFGANPPQEETAHYCLLKTRSRILNEKIERVPIIVDQEICQEIVLKIAKLMTSILLTQDYQKIKPEIAKNLDVCREFASQLASYHAYPEYQPLIKAFVEDVEQRADEGKLPLEFAWAIYQQARLLFSTYYTLNNKVQAPVRLPKFLVLAWSKKFRTGLDGFVSSNYKESEFKELTIDGNAESFYGLTEFYTGGKIDKFLQLYQGDLQALGHLWKLADQLLIDSLKTSLKSEKNLHPSFLGLMEFLSSGALKQFLQTQSSEEAVRGLWWLSELMKLEGIQKILQHNFHISLEETDAAL